MKKKLCIFCEGTGLSKEHFWPDWIRNYISISTDDKYISEVHTGEAKSPTKLKDKTERAGNLITKKFRVVCIKCNNGWMSDLEEAVKPIILSGMQNTNMILNSQQVDLFSRWVVMKVLVAEQSEDGTQVTPMKDRRIFYEDNVIPSYFRIYLAKHNTNDIAAYRRDSATLAISESGPLANMEGHGRNTQTISFLIGSLFVYIVACREDNIKLWSNFKLNQLKCIFPFNKKSLSMKSLKTISQPRLADISYSLEDFTSSSHVKYGGSLPPNKNI